MRRPFSDLEPYDFMSVEPILYALYLLYSCYKPEVRKIWSLSSRYLWRSLRVILKNSIWVECVQCFGQVGYETKSPGFRKKGTSLSVEGELKGPGKKVEEIGLEGWIRFQEAQKRSGKAEN